VVQCIAVCYSEMQGGAVCVASCLCPRVHPGVLQCIAVCCSVMQCGAVCVVSGKLGREFGLTLKNTWSRVTHMSESCHTHE